MRIAMIGCGYVGLVSGACFADFGHSVVCIDADEERIKMLNGGEVPIHEPGLKELVAKGMQAQRLSFAQAMVPHVRDADVVMIAVGTPRAGDGHADLTHVEAAAREIAASLSGFTVVVTKSTVPVGTGDAIEAIILAENPAAEFAVVSNPEFLREGAAIADFKIPDRIVVGCEDARARAVMEELYRSLYLNAAPLVFTSRRTAELTKYAANAFLAMKISFINEIADLCDALGADVQDVARGMGLDRRIGPKFLHPGPGFGGSCFPKDIAALAQTGRDAGVVQRLVEATMAVNAARSQAMVDKIVEACRGSVEGKRIAILGLSFKPETDDMREAPSVAIIRGLQARGALIAAYDPSGHRNAAKVLDDVVFAPGAYEAAAGAECVVIVTEWNAFRSLDFTRLTQVVASPVLVDLRNIYRPADIARRGFRYYSVGQSAGSGA